MSLLEQLIRQTVQTVQDRITVIRLRQAVMRLKAQKYDLLAENVLGLRRAIDTQRRQVEELQHQIDEREKQIHQLRQEYTELAARQSAAGTSSVRDERVALFKRLQTVMTQLPTMRAAVDGGADLRAADVLDVIRPLDQALTDLGFTAIGAAGEEIIFDPTRHRAVGKGAQSVHPEDRVRVRYVGYLYEGEVVCKAEVTLVNQTESVSK